MRNILLSAATVLMAGAALIAPAHSAELPKGAVHNIVLVHGAFVDQTSWQPVADILTKKGYNVTLVENPLTSLTADVDATKQALAKQDGRTVLVGHSWGGVVITQAGANPKVSSLVYVAAFAPDQGMSVTNLISGFPAAPWTSTLQQDDSGNLTLSETGYLTYFAPDLPARQARVLAAEQGATFANTLNNPVSQVAWRSKRAWYVLAEEDQMIAPELQRAMSSRMHAHVVPVRSSHVVMLSHPDAVAAVILEAVLARP